MKSNIEGITEQNHLRLKNPIKRKRHPDEIKDRENYRRMKGIPVPNYTINKGMLAENMATAAVEYPFTLAENMVGRPEELHRGRLLKGTGDNYGNGG